MSSETRTNHIKTISKLDDNYYFIAVSPKHKISIKSFQCLFYNSLYKLETQKTVKSNHRCLSLNEMQFKNTTMYSPNKSVYNEDINQKMNSGNQLIQSLTTSNILSSHLLNKKSNQHQFKYQKYLNQYIDPKAVELKKHIFLETLRGNKTKEQIKPSPFIHMLKPIIKDNHFNQDNLLSSPSSRFQYIITQPLLKSKKNLSNISSINIQNKHVF